MTMLAKNDSLLKTTLKTTALCLLPMLFYTQNAQAEGKLTVYCSVQNVTCEKVTKRFAEKYHVDTQFVRNSTGTVLGKIKAEKDNPQADVWFGGTFEPHLQAADQGLLAVYRSPLQKDIMPQFKKLMDERGDYTSIIYLMEVAIGVNTEYLKKLNANVAQYSKSGLATGNLSTGEVSVDVSFMHSYVREKDKGAPVKGILPCEGVGYTLGAVSIIKGARNLENAKHFVDFVLDAEAQEIPWRESDSYQIPTNIHAKASPKASDPTKLKLLDIDFIRFGADAESKRLIERWVKITQEEK